MSERKNVLVAGANGTTGRIIIELFAAGSKGKNIIDVDQEGAKSLTDAAKQAVFEMFVMLSSMGADNPAVSDDLEDYLGAKQNADDHLKASGLSYNIIRPGSLTDKGSTGKIEIKKSLEKRGTISRTDVAKTIFEALDDDVIQNQTFEILSGEDPIERVVRS